ncbi:MAG: hypothetical protein JKX76_03255 [Colwellia sp.]|nr:hypothetical protein [Colwellia sp.]
MLNVFAEIVAVHDEDASWKSVKAVWATEGVGRHIGAYWPDFDRRKSMKSPRPECLFDIVCRKWWQHNQGSEQQYKLIVHSVLDLLRIANVADPRSAEKRYFNVNGLKSWLKENDCYSVFRELIADWIVNDFPSNDQWNCQTGKLKTMLGIADSDEVKTYLAYNNVGWVDEVDLSAGNVFRGENGRNIEVGTIHSVKGETHDATLVLETKYHQNDIQQLLNHIAGIDSGKIVGRRKIKFARLLYVASSRPRHLLCLAVHKDNLSEEQCKALKGCGWSVNPIHEVIDER